MNCTRMKAATHWRNVGFTAAKRGWTFEQVRLPGDRVANEWIREGMMKWLRKATRLGMNRAEGRKETS